MPKGLLRSLSRGPVLDRGVIRRVFPIENLAISMTGATGVGFGTAVVGDFETGRVVVVGTRSTLTITEASASIIDTFSGDFGIGSTPLTDGTISAGDVDMLASTAFGPAVSSSVTVSGVSTATEFGTILNNDSGALEINLNVLLDDASISGDDDITVNGTVELSYLVF